MVINVRDGEVFYFQLKEFISAENDEIAALLSTWYVENKLLRVLDDLKEFESVSHKLQEADGVTLLDARALFDILIDKQTAVASYQKADANIAILARFESTCDTALEGNRLAAEGKTALAPPKATQPEQPPDERRAVIVYARM